MKTTKLNPRISVARLTRQRGASLLEGIAYLGIAAIVVLGAVSLLTGAFSSAQSNRVAEEVVSIRTGVKKLYMGQGAGYTAAVLDPTLIAAQVFPTTLNIAGAVITNAWGGTVSVSGVVAGAQFAITYTLVPDNVCINVLSGASGWTSIVAGTGGASAPIILFPVTPVAAAGVCAAGTNTITWTSL